jgi:predicted transposase YbfD/YdcC
MEAVSLWSCLEKIPDPRGRQGIRYPLPAMIGVVMAAVLAGRTSLRGIARWAKKLAPEQLAELGVPPQRKRAPSQTALHGLLDKLPVQPVETALGAWVRGLLGGASPGHIALDGKTLRASKGAEYPALHLLAAFCVDVHGVLHEEAVPDKANEITAAKAMLGRLPLNGAVVTGDAMFCQKELCRRITEGGGHFIFTVKGNQAGLRDDVAATFATAFSPGEGPARRAAHNRRQGARSPGGTPHRGLLVVWGVPGLAGSPAGVPHPSAAF